MRTRDIKALNETIASVVDPADADRAKALQEGYLNSLTEKARQVISEAVETEKEDEVEAIMKRLAAKALKKAKKKARRSSGDDAYAGINPSAAKTDPDMKNPGRVAEELINEVAAPGMEDWASDPKVKASFKKQYGKRWKEVMYGHSWNLAKKEKELGVNEEVELDLAEGVSAKRMRIIRKHLVSGKPITGKVKDFMDRSIQKQLYRDKTKFSGATPAYPSYLERARRKHSAMKAKGLAEAEQLDELKVLGSIKTGFKKGGLVGAVKSGAKALKHNIKRGGIVGDTADDQLRDNFLRRATNKAIDKSSPHGTAAAARAVARVSKLKNIKGLRRRFKGAVESKFSDRTQHTVKPMIAKRVGEFNAANAKKSVSEANELNEADYKKLMRLKKKAYNTRNPKIVRATAELEAKVAANMARRGGASAEAVKAGGSRIGKSGKYTQKAGNLANQRDRALAKFRGRAVAGGAFNPPGPEKRKRQQAQAEFSNRARSGDFGQNNQEGMRPRYNYLKRTGKLKTYK